MARSSLVRGTLTALAWALLGAGVAHAHGGMAGPDEIGPPVGISVSLGLACYYLITLWPARNPRNGREAAGKAGRRTAS